MALLTTSATALAACSGAADSGLFGTPPASEATPTDPTPPSATPSSTATTTPPAADAAPPPMTPDAGLDAAPPTAPCTMEVEPDDDLADATTFTASFCGEVKGVNDVDFGRFVVPMGAPNLKITHSEKDGKVAYRYYKNGQLLPIAAELLATPGAVYSVSIRLAAGSRDNDHPSYQLNVSFE